MFRVLVRPARLNSAQIRLGFPFVGSRSHMLLMNSRFRSYSTAKLNIVDIDKMLSSQHKGLAEELRRIRFQSSGLLDIKQQDLVRLLLAACQQDPQYAISVAEELILAMPSWKLEGTLDALVSSYEDMQMDLHNISDIILVLLDHGVVPLQSSSVGTLKTVFCRHLKRTHGEYAIGQNKRLLQTILKLASSSQVQITPAFLRFVVEWTAILPAPLKRFDSIQQIALRLYEKSHQTPGKTTTSADSTLFWASVLKHHKNVEVPVVLNAMTAFGANLNTPEINAAIIMREHDLWKCEQLIREYQSKWGQDDKYIQIVTHYLRLAAVDKQYLTIHDVEQRLEISAIYRPKLLQGVLRGAFEAGEYRQVFEIHHAIIASDPDPQSLELSSSYAISAMAATGETGAAVEKLHQLMDTYDRASEDTLFYVIRGIISQGRKSYGEKSPSSPIIPLEQASTQIEEILQKKGISLRASPYLAKLLASFNHLDMSYRDTKLWCLALSRLFLKHSRTPEDQSCELLDTAAVRQIVWWGFSKSPRTPWSSMDLFQQLKALNIELPTASIINSYSHIIANLYALHPKGPFVRIRQQMDPNMTLKELISKLSSEWKAASL